MVAFTEPTNLPGLVSEINPGVGTVVRNFSTAAQNIASTTRVQIAGTQLLVPAGGLKVGARIKFVFDVTKTNAGTATAVFDIAFGTDGTVADTARVSFTKTVGTAAVDSGKITIEAIVRSVSATGVVVGTFTLVHRLAITGLIVLPGYATVVSGTFDNDGQELFITLNATLGASDDYTIQMVEASLSGV